MTSFIKKFIILPVILVFLNIGETYGQNSNLYLEFNHDKKSMTAVKYGDDRYIYEYRFSYKEKSFSPVEFVEFNNGIRYEITKAEYDTLNVKDYKWLRTYFLEYFNYFKEAEPYVEEDGTLKFFNLDEFKRIYILRENIGENTYLMSPVHYEDISY